MPTWVMTQKCPPLWFAFFVPHSLVDGKREKHLHDITIADEEIKIEFMQGYGALYIVTAFPVIIGISVVLILFYNSLQ